MGMKMLTNTILFAFIFSLVSVSCDKDPVQKGDEAFKKSQFLDAQKYYEKALKENPDDNQIKVKLMTAYFRTGETYYETKKLVTAFEGQVKQGFAFLPESPADSTKEIISNTLLNLATAFKEAPAENEYQKKELTDKAVHYLRESIKYDSSNTSAFDELESIKNEEIDNIIKKGEAYFKAGANKSENYFIAEDYFLDALELYPGNENASKFLKLTRNKILTIYNYEQFTPLKILKRSWIGELLVFEIKILNNTNRPMDLKGDGFYLIASDGSKLGGFFSEKFSMPYITKKLASGKEESGVVSFEASSNKRYIKLEYDGGEKFEGSKHLP
jgi:tetratricopeptide (TPR) repeat protein